MFKGQPRARLCAPPAPLAALPRPLRELERLVRSWNIFSPSWQGTGGKCRPCGELGTCPHLHGQRTSSCSQGLGPAMGHGARSTDGSPQPQLLWVMRVQEVTSSPGSQTLKHVQSWIQPCLASIFCSMGCWGDWWVFPPPHCLFLRSLLYGAAGPHPDPKNLGKRGLKVGAECPRLGV